MKRLLPLLFIAFTMACSAEKMHSPTKNIQAEILVEKGQLFYSVKFNNTTVLEKSRMGITVDSVDLGSNVQVKLVDEKYLEESYATRGVHSVAQSKCRAYTFSVNHPSQSYTIETKLFDDGFAYRYIVPMQGIHRVNGESSSWKLPSGNIAWFAERLSNWKLLTYAGEWISAPVDSLYKISSQGPIQLMPLVVELKNNQGYAVVTEAALYDYSGMRLEAKQDGLLSANFTEKEGFELDGNIVTPWRVTILAKDLNTLVNSDIITSLNPVADKDLFADQSWIKQGRSVWSWWSDPTDFMTIEGEKKMINYAADLSFEYTMVDEGWERLWKNKWTTLKKLCNYGKQKNVGVFVWRHWNMLNNPDNDYSQMALFLDSVAQAGCAGIKVDFMNGETKSIVDFDITLLKYAAQRKLLVNFHGCQKPSGEMRTYPNEITREGVRGIELNRITSNYVKKQAEKGIDASLRPYIPGGENQNIPATHNAALPFTRCVLGAADYTPIAFSKPGNTTWAHQLATAYLITSPMLVMAEHPAYLFSEPKLQPVIPFIKKLPAIWDETIVLPESKIGRLAAMARRSGSTWYIAVLAAGDKKELTIPLDFLSAEKYALRSIADVADDAQNLKYEEREVAKGDKISIALNSNGGYVARIEILQK